MSRERAAQLVDAGIWLRLSGDIDGARRLFEQALKLDPQNQRAVELLAQGPTAVLEPKSIRRTPASIGNPFEPASRSPSDVDWGAATEFEVRSSSPSPTAPSARPGRATPTAAASPSASGPREASIASASIPRQAPELVGPIPLGDLTPPQTTVMFSLAGPEADAGALAPPAANGAFDSLAQLPPAPSANGSGVSPRLGLAPSSGFHGETGSTAGAEVGVSVPFVTETSVSSSPVPPTIVESLERSPVPFVTESPAPLSSGASRSPQPARQAPPSSLPFNERPTIPSLFLADLASSVGEAGPVAPSQEGRAGTASSISTGPPPSSRSPIPTQLVPPSIPPVASGPRPSEAAVARDGPQAARAASLGEELFGQEENPRWAMEPLFPRGEGAREADPLSPKEPDVSVAPRDVASDRSRRGTLPFGTEPAVQSGPPVATSAKGEPPPGPRPPARFDPVSIESARPSPEATSAVAAEPADLEPISDPSTSDAGSSASDPLAGADLEMLDVRPMVIRLDLDEELAEPPSIVDMLKSELDAVRKPAARTVVLTDTTAERNVRSAPSAVMPSSSPPGPERGRAPREPSSPKLGPAPARTSWATPAPAVETAPLELSDVADPQEASIVDPSREGPPSASGLEAWSWSAGSGSRSPIDEKGSLTPRPSPALSPQASSAWDVRGSPGIRIDDMVGPDRTLELVAAPGTKAPRSPDSVRVEVASLLSGARDLIDLDDHTGAMELIAKAQVLAPDDPEVLRLRERSERTLLAMFESKLGDLGSIPRVLLKDDEIIWLNLDHRAGFVLAQIDGTVNFEDLFAVSGMSRLDTGRILTQLVDEGVISRGAAR
jgi:hypothetical protein